MLSRDSILAAGLSLVDEVGPQKLTMRGLASKLDVSATAIYYYFKGREELLEAIVDVGCADLVSKLPETGDWTERLRTLLTAMVDQGAAHPSVVTLSIENYPRLAPVLRIHDAILRVLDDAGFTPTDALHIKAILLRYTIGHQVVQEMPVGLSWRELPKGQFEYYRAARDALDAFDAQAHFQAGLDAIFAGIATTTPTTARRRRPRPKGLTLSS